MSKNLNIIFFVIFTLICAVTLPGSQAFARDTLSHYCMWLAFFCAAGGTARSLYLVGRV